MSQQEIKCHDGVVHVKSYSRNGSISVDEYNRRCGTHASHNGVKSAWSPLEVKASKEGLFLAAHHELAETYINRDIEAAEKFVASLYWDKNGFLTIGYGINIEANPDIWEKIEFIKPDGKRATKEEKRIILEKARATKSTYCKYIPSTDKTGKRKYDCNYAAEGQDQLIPLGFIEKEEGQKVSKEYLFLKVLPVLKNKLAKVGIPFHALHKGAQLALLDLHYNLGNKLQFGLDKTDKRNWVNLTHALLEKDWMRASKETHRGEPINQTRNDITAAYMLNFDL